jgi:cytochrome c556
MKRLAYAVAGLALLAGIAMAAEPTIKEIMTKAHKGSKSLLGDMNAELKEDEPDWNDIQKDSKELVELGTSLGKNKPPKGEQSSWEQLTKNYLTNAKELDTAAQGKNKAAAKMALGKLQGSCKDCHMNHRPK